MFDKFYQELAKKYHLDPRIIKEICQSPFKFASTRMYAADLKPMRFTYLFTIKPKTNCIKRLQDEAAKETETI